MMEGKIQVRVVRDVLLGEETEQSGMMASESEVV